MNNSNQSPSPQVRPKNSEEVVTSLSSGSPVEVRSPEDQALLEDVRQIRKSLESLYAQELVREHDRMQAHRLSCHEEDCPLRLLFEKEAGTP